MAGLAIMVMVGAVLAQHLGLTEAVVRILLKVARCPKCCTFWAILAVFALKGYDLPTTTFIALISAYLSHWLGLALMWVNSKYGKIWQRLQEKM